MSTAAPSPGLLASLRRLQATVLEIAQIRIELVGAEPQQEKLCILATSCALPRV